METEINIIWNRSNNSGKFTYERIQSRFFFPSSSYSPFLIYFIPIELVRFPFRKSCLSTYRLVVCMMKIVLQRLLITLCREEGKAPPRTTDMWPMMMMGREMPTSTTLEYFYVFYFFMLLFLLCSPWVVPEQIYSSTCHSAENACTRYISLSPCLPSRRHIDDD